MSRCFIKYFTYIGKLINIDICDEFSWFCFWTVFSLDVYHRIQMCILFQTTDTIVFIFVSGTCLEFENKAFFFSAEFKNFSDAKVYTTQ